MLFLIPFQIHLAIVIDPFIPQLNFAGMLIRPSAGTFYSHHFHNAASVGFEPTKALSHFNVLAGRPVQPLRQLALAGAMAYPSHRPLLTQCVFNTHEVSAPSYVTPTQ